MHAGTPRAHTSERLRGSLSVALIGSLARAASACSNQPNGALVVAVETDVPLPKDVDTIEIQVEADGSVQFDNPYAVGSGHLLVPATLTLLPGSTVGEPVTIRLLAYQGNTVRMLRQTITTVPTTRVATLLMPIQWLDFGMTTGGSVMNASGVESTCPSGQTPDEGACVNDTVDATTLPEYSAAAVFGGGDGTGDGVCYDLLGCFSASTVATLDKSDCSIANPANDVVNVAFVLQPSLGDGECGAQGCLVPLPSGTGWVKDGARIKLPRAVCTNPKVVGARVSTATTASSTKSCATMTSTTALCGSWSSVSVGTGDGELDGGTPDATLPTDASTEEASTVTCGGQSCSGTCSASGGCIAPIATDVSAGGFLVRGSTIYWVHGSDILGGPTAGAGASRAVVRDAGSVSSIAADDVALYWTASDTSGLASTVNKLVLDGGNHIALASGQELAANIAVSAAGVFWTANGGDIVSVPTAGAAIPVTLVSGQGIEQMAVSDSTVYWTDYEQDAVLSVPVQPVDGGTITTVAADQDSPAGILVTPASVYWAAGGGTVVRLTIDAGTTTTLIADAGSLYGIAVDTTSIYATNDSDSPPGAIVRAPLDGGSVVTLATNQIGPQSIGVNDASVFWTSGQANGAYGLERLTPK